MTREEAISALQFDMDMMLFDPYTGDSYSKEILENKSKHGNSMDYPVYCAKEMAIKSLQAWDEVIADFEQLQKYNARHGLFEIANCYKDAVEFIKQKLGEVEL